MHTFDDIDADLFGMPATDLAYDGGTRPDRWEEGRVERATVLLDMKADSGGEPLDEMQTMLSEMTKELRERFQRFQSQRRTAEHVADAAEDEADRKLAQADAKAAIEAVSLIVRTLEKIDSLQRAILSERRDADERRGEVADYDAVVAEFDRRVNAKVQAYIEQWKADHERCGTGSAADPGMGPAKGAGEDGANSP
ncbi:hypothetical protein J2Y48_002474 [Mycoplana sp. BE70]|uniref:hypothetical protein n=1 Tax=Mycoplana sp. BE70 TaxID=2817775 RepID=UPI00285DE69C|nr:hypothetical protein [Mycoplana sp. BE70]MDR6757178.1 hypothetical protein [Mycoplana sp. BE70]